MSRRVDNEFPSEHRFSFFLSYVLFAKRVGILSTVTGELGITPFFFFVAPQAKQRLMGGNGGHGPDAIAYT